MDSAHALMSDVLDNIRKVDMVGLEEARLKISSRLEQQKAARASLATRVSDLQRQVADIHATNANLQERSEAAATLLVGLKASWCRAVWCTHISRAGGFF